MTQEPEGSNPFAGAGFDMNALLQQAQQMQQQIVEAQDELAQMEIVGTAGGNVTVTVDGTGDLTKVDILPGTFDLMDSEDLGDTIVAAYRDAKSKAEAYASEKLGPLAGGFGGDTEGGGAPGGLGQLGS